MSVRIAWVREETSAVADSILYVVCSGGRITAKLTYRTIVAVDRPENRWEYPFVSCEPFDWNVIIVGRWNQAILTPAGIAKHVFKVGLGQPLPVKVPIDGLMPYLVGDPDDCVEVAVEANRLQVQLKRTEYDVLEMAMGMGVNALESLPHTPVTAAGFNINFRQNNSDLEHASLTAHSQIDNALSDSGFVISRRTTSRGLAYNAGMLNVDVTTDTKGLHVSFNFHCASNDSKDLIQWLRQSGSETKSCIMQILDRFGLEIREASHDNDTSEQ